MEKAGKKPLICCPGSFAGQMKVDSLDQHIIKIQSIQFDADLYPSETNISRLEADIPTRVEASHGPQGAHALFAPRCLYL